LQQNIADAHAKMVCDVMSTSLTLVENVANVEKQCSRFFGVLQAPFCLCPGITCASEAKLVHPVNNRGVFHCCTSSALLFIVNAEALPGTLLCHVGEAANVCVGVQGMILLLIY
jgi:hypothetical protein